MTLIVNEIVFRVNTGHNTCEPENRDRLAADQYGITNLKALSTLISITFGKLLSIFRIGLVLLSLSGS